MAEEESSAAAERRYQTHIAMLLAVAALSATLIGARAENLASAAGGEWEKSVRFQVKRGTAETSAEILVYGAVPAVTTFQSALIRGDEYARELDRRNTLTRPERDGLHALALLEAARANNTRGTLGAERRYFSEDYERYDLERRLADQRLDSVASLEDPLATRMSGDHNSTDAILEAFAGLPAALAIVLASIAHAIGRSRRALLLAGGIAVASSIAAALILEAVAFH